MSHLQRLFLAKILVQEKGQIKVLETILNSDLNVENISLEELSKIIEEQKIKTIRNSFPILMGYNKSEYKKYSQHFDKVVFSMPNVRNYEETLKSLQNDKNFERLIQAMTSDLYMGKSPLAKGKAIRNL
mgnify:CR=1 FL=1